MMLGPILSQLFQKKPDAVQMAAHEFGGIPVGLETLSGTDPKGTFDKWRSIVSNIKKDTAKSTEEVKELSNQGTEQVINALMQQYAQGSQYLQPYINMGQAAGSQLLSMYGAGGTSAGGTGSYYNTAVNSPQAAASRRVDMSSMTPQQIMSTMSSGGNIQPYFSKPPTKEQQFTYDGALNTGRIGSRTTAGTSPGSVTGLQAPVPTSGSAIGQAPNVESLIQQFSGNNLNNLFGNVNTGFTQSGGATQAINQAQSSLSNTLSPNGIQSQFQQPPINDVLNPSNYARPNTNLQLQDSTNQAVNTAMSALQRGADPQQVAQMFQQPQLGNLNFQQMATDTLGALGPALQQLGQGFGSEQLGQFSTLGNTAPQDFATNTMKALFDTTSGVAQPYIDALVGQGSKAVQNSAAAKGMLNSGRTLDELNKMGIGTAASYLNPLIQSGMNSATGLADSILGAGSSLANTRLSSMYNAGAGLTSDVMSNSLQNLLSNQNNQVSMRGQDMGMYSDMAKTMSGMASTMRGQDVGYASDVLGANTAMRGQDTALGSLLANLGVNMRGQDMGMYESALGLQSQLGSTLRGQDVTQQGNALTGQVQQRGQNTGLAQSLANLGVSGYNERLGMATSALGNLSNQGQQLAGQGAGFSNQLGQNLGNQYNWNTSNLANAIMANRGSQSQYSLMDANALLQASMTPTFNAPEVWKFMNQPKGGGGFGQNLQQMGGIGMMLGGEMGGVGGGVVGGLGSLGALLGGFL